MKKSWVILAVLAILVISILFFISYKLLDKKGFFFSVNNFIVKEQLEPTFKTKILPPPIITDECPEKIITPLSLIFNDNRFCTQNPELCILEPDDNLPYPLKFTSEYNPEISRYAIDLITRCTKLSKKEVVNIPTGLKLLTPLYSLASYQFCSDGSTPPLTIFGLIYQEIAPPERIWIVFREASGILEWILNFLEHPKPAPSLLSNYTDNEPEVPIPPNSEVNFGLLEQGFTGTESIQAMYGDENPDGGMIILNKNPSVLTATEPERKAFSKKDTPVLNKPLKGHSGFLTLYSFMRDQIFSVLKSLSSPKQIILTGHGTGSAIATLAVLDVFSSGNTDILVYGYGTPRVLNQDISPWTTGFFRINNISDIVPSFPMAVSPNYKNACSPYYFIHSGQGITFDQNRYSLFENHSLKAVLDNTTGPNAKIFIKTLDKIPIVHPEPKSGCPSKKVSAINMCWNDPRFNTENFSLANIPVNNNIPYPNLSSEYDSIMSRYCTDLILRTSEASKGNYPSAPPDLYLDELLYGIHIQIPCSPPGKNISGAIYREKKFKGINEGRVWISFRGTSGIVEWALNSIEHQVDPYVFSSNISSIAEGKKEFVDVSSIPFNNNSQVILERPTKKLGDNESNNLLLPLACHAGFNKTYSYFKNQIESYMTNIDRNSPIILTGHSSGSAMATLCLVHLNSLGFNNIYVYVYGTPRVLNQDISFWAKCFFRINNTTDLITQFPLAVSPNFKKWCEPFYFSHCGTSYAVEQNRYSIINCHCLPPIIEST